MFKQFFVQGKMIGCLCTYHVPDEFASVLGIIHQSGVVIRCGDDYCVGIIYRQTHKFLVTDRHIGYRADIYALYAVKQ